MRSMTTGERDPGRYRLGARVKEARGRLSLRAVAKKAGIAVETLWQMEQGRRRDDKPWSRPQPDTVLAVARALRIPDGEALSLADYDPADYIVTGEGGPSVSAPPVLAAKLHRLDDGDLAAIEHVVDSLLRAKGYIPPEGSGVQGVDVARKRPNGSVTVWETKTYPGQPAVEDVVSGLPQVAPGEEPVHEEEVHRLRSDDRVDQPGR